MSKERFDIWVLVEDVFKYPAVGDVNIFWWLSSILADGVGVEI
jgi:hypothetical protein